MIYSLIFPYTLIYWENFSGGFFQFIGTFVIGVLMCIFLARGQFNGSGSRANIGQIR
jgi:amino acid permease